MRESINNLSLQVICDVGFGLSVDVIKDQAHALKSNIDAALLGVGKGIRNPFASILPKFANLRKSARCVAASLRQFGRDYVLSHMRTKEESHDIFGSIMLQEVGNGELSVEDFIDEFVTLFIAGYETTSTTIAWALQEVLIHPDIKEKLIREVNEVLDGNEFVSTNHLSSLTYTSHIMKETLRRHPPAPGVLRTTNVNTEMCGYYIPKGTLLTSSFYAVHHRPDYWEDPMKFDPNRFDTKDILPFFAFSAGPRVCLGKLFAEIEFKVTLARLFQAFEMELEPGQETDKETTLFVVRPGSEVRCRLTPRCDKEI